MLLSRRIFAQPSERRRLVRPADNPKGHSGATETVSQFGISRFSVRDSPFVYNRNGRSEGEVANDLEEVLQRIR